MYKLMGSEANVANYRSFVSNYQCVQSYIMKAVRDAKSVTSLERFLQRGRYDGSVVNYPGNI